ncbi:MAG: hypothetical protein IOC86_10600, partial [Aestuariivirga sp.]|nr:hypothetical protein [Aestuariivirga sp.]
MRAALPIMALLLTTTGSHASPVPRFIEETAGSGIDSIYAGEWQYMVGGGAAVFDCNGDGFEDVFL